MTVLLEPVERLWKCPSCEVRDRTFVAGPISRMHPCGALNGITVPLVEVKNFDEMIRARHVAVEREDYIGASGASPISAIRTERADGSNDCTVLAPTANVKLIH